MPETPPVRDENLRMILSAQEEGYIRGRIREFRRMARATAILLAIGAVWLAADTGGLFLPAGEAECVTIVPAPSDTRSADEIARSMGVTACPPEIARRPADEGPTWRDARGWAKGLALVFVLYGAFGVIRNVLLWRRWTGYLEDHRAFLEKYRRT